MSYGSGLFCECGHEIEWRYEVDPWAPIRYVYAVAAGDYVKFGITRSGIAGRMHAIQTGNPKRLEVLGVVTLQTDDPEDAPWIERSIHDYCRPDGETGEWFKRASPLVAGVLAAFADKERPVEAVLSITRACHACKLDRTRQKAPE